MIESILGELLKKMEEQWRNAKLLVEHLMEDTIIIFMY
jgi:hypothetical protein